MVKNGVLREMEKKLEDKNTHTHKKKKKSTGRLRKCEDVTLYGVQGSIEVRQAARSVRLGDYFRTISRKVSKTSSRWSRHIRRTRG